MFVFDEEIERQKKTLELEALVEKDDSFKKQRQKTLRFADMLAEKMPDLDALFKWLWGRSKNQNNFDTAYNLQILARYACTFHQSNLRDKKVCSCNLSL